MFRISRLRIRLADPNPPATSGTTPQKHLRGVTPWNWRVHVRWVGFGYVSSPAAPASISEHAAILPPDSIPGRILRSFELPGMKVSVRWVGFGTGLLSQVFVLGVLAACVWLGLFVLTRPPDAQNVSPIEMQIVPDGLMVSEVDLAGVEIRLAHSPLDIGQAADAFDRNLETLMRGQDANPFIADFEFAEPRPIRGILLDFGRMDFVIRIQVYGVEEALPFYYGGEFRGQPEIPHVDIDFTEGPGQVRRIYIEIEQLDPPKEVHIHLREVAFKE